MNSTKTAHTSSRRRSPLRSIREKCIDCCAGNKAEVARCPIQACALWPFRMGHNPNRAKVLGEAPRPLRCEIFPKKETAEKDTRLPPLFHNHFSVRN
jgi:hypothetical protein